MQAINSLLDEKDMAVTSGQTKVMVIPEAKKVEVDETVRNCPAPAATPADITDATGGNSTVDIKESTARVARIVREDAAEGKWVIPFMAKNPSNLTVVIRESHTLT